MPPPRKINVSGETTILIAWLGPLLPDTLIFRGKHATSMF